ncbi:MAG TPA: transposase [Allocoleopsis sp.]
MLIAQERFVYVDEAGVDNTENYAYGYCHKSSRFYDVKLGHKTARINMIAGWSYGGLIAPMTFTGKCDALLVEHWVKEFLIPELLPRQIILIDPASFQREWARKELIAPLGCQVIFLPKYSPDLNNIQKFWSRLKHYLRQIISQFDNF